MFFQSNGPSTFSRAGMRSPARFLACGCAVRFAFSRTSNKKESHWESPFCILHIAAWVTSLKVPLRQCAGAAFLCANPTDGRVEDIDQQRKDADGDDNEKDEGGDAVHFQGFPQLIALGAEAFVFKTKQLGDGFRSGQSDTEVRIHVDAESIADRADGVDRGAF